MISRHGDWLSARVGDEIMMMSAAHGVYLGLNEVGARIWDLIETPQPREALYAALQGEFEVDAETCRSEVDDFLEELLRRGAAVSDPG
ncbi:PqqD family peptide modification chaperone [Novosphingobium naphthalenivorans]|uniref:PqqD family peptide modification chaperone n=1 Tax=Novosphingobium naphthalenivorans TaxID=273168 RepID=UPI0008303B07|nr:PqqD family peptide modification chaperone [Novosphingobium naphthalenivorans]